MTLRSAMLSTVSLHAMTIAAPPTMKEIAAAIYDAAARLNIKATEVGS